MSDARGKAPIIGLNRRDAERLFSYDDIKGDPKESTHQRCRHIYSTQAALRTDT
jgi:hypothetical protein